MTRIEFMDSLRRALAGSLTSSTVNENMRYYEEYFDMQIRSGQSEEEVVNSLGDPRLLAKTIIEAAKYQARKWQIVYKVLIPESLPALVSGITVTAISLIGYTAMAGAIGAGGLGQLAYTDGFQSYNNAITLVATAVIVVIVFVFQYLGDFSVRKIDKR